MRALARGSRVWLVGLAVLWAWLVGFSFWKGWITAPPLDRPISLSPPGHVEADVHIRLAETYFLAVEFSTRGVPRAEAGRLIGSGQADRRGDISDPGIGVPIRWSLTSLGSGQVLVSEAVESHGSYAHGQHDISRRVGASFTPEPGSYRLRAEVIRDVPELAGLPARLVLATSPKSYSSWRSELLFWGGLANVYLIAPISLLLSAILAVRGAGRR